MALGEVEIQEKRVGGAGHFTLGKRKEINRFTIKMG